MQHLGEKWQVYDLRGERVMDGGFVPKNEPVEYPVTRYFGGCAIMLYRFHDGEVEYLFQQRSNLVWNPLKWDTSAGGHVNYNEKTLAAAVRESREELGVDLAPEKLEFYARFVRADALINLFFYDYTGKADDFKFDDQEVAAVKWVKASELEDFWPNLKTVLQDDKTFIFALGEMTEKIQKKYE